jgi:Domain of unknown function (DUF4328)
MSISIFDPVPVQLAPSSEAAPGLAGAIRWGRVTVVSLVAWLLVWAAVIASSLWCLTLVHQLASGATLTKDEVAVVLGALRVTSRLEGLVSTASMISLLVWVYKSYASLNHLGTRRTRYAPTWAVVVWLLPFLNFIEPYRVVRELWLRSAGLNATEPDLGEKTPLISVWWALFLISNLVALVVAALRSLGIRDPARVFEVILASQVLYASAALLTIMIVRRIGVLQHHALAQPDAEAT